MLPFIFSGGDEGDRTPYLLNAIQALSQVSYTPKCLLEYTNTLFFKNQAPKSINFLTDAAEIFPCGTLIYTVPVTVRVLVPGVIIHSPVTAS